MPFRRGMSAGISRHYRKVSGVFRHGMLYGISKRYTKVPWHSGIECWMTFQANTEKSLGASHNQADWWVNEIQVGSY
jgi:hypothetical protein